MIQVTFPSLACWENEIVWGGRRVDAQQSVAAITEMKLPGDSDVQSN